MYEVSILRGMRELWGQIFLKHKKRECSICLHDGGGGGGGVVANQSQLKSCKICDILKRKWGCNVPQLLLGANQELGC